MRKGPYTVGPASHMRHRAFTGKKAGKRVRRRGLTRKQRASKRGTHINAYRN